MSDWVNVNDRLPPDREFLVCDKFGRRFVAELSGGSDKHFTEIYRGERLSGITHWMPLPRPPKLD